MTFLNIRFPSDIRYGFTGGPVYQTDISSADPAKQKRRSRFADPVYQFSADLQRFENNMPELIAFFRLAKGALNSFRFKDWLDYSATDQQIGTGDGTKTTFQLIKIYTVDAYSEQRIITKPVLGTVVVKVNGITETGLTIDHTTGIIEFNTAPAPAASITASFEFDVHVRFDQDALPISKNNPTTFDAAAIKLIEVTG